MLNSEGNLKLRILAPELAALPWEFLYDSRQAEYVCLSRNTPVVRYLELPRPIPPLSVTPPLRILGMIASPHDLEPLDIAREKERVERALKALQARGLAELTWLEGQSWRHLQGVMRHGPWHVFHFIGHGGFDRAGDEGFIVLADEEGETYRLSAAHLGRLLADHRSLRLALLNACEGARGSQHDIFSSTATILVRRGLPAVLAMQYEITDQAAIELAHAFYEALAEGMPVDAAVAEARKAVSFAVANSVEWGTPVLYMRSPDGVLFTIQSPEPGREQKRAVAREGAGEARPAEPKQEPARPAPAPAVSTRLPFEPELILIPAGEFLMGSDPGKDKDAFEDEQPQHTLYLPDYHIARTPVTNAQYAAFVKATNHSKPGHWEGGKLPGSKEDHPVVAVSWHDAMAYCRWLSESTGKTYRLPSEAEWEKAARGAEGRIYPWGDQWDPKRCNTKEGGPGDTTPVAHFSPQGDSSYGCVDMAGNVWEWTLSLWGKDLTKPEFKYPYDSKDGRENLKAGDDVLRVVRGGSWDGDRDLARCAYRGWDDPIDGWSYRGFRIVVSPISPASGL